MVLDTFENEPSNLTMIKEYESMAKTHLNKYFAALKVKEKEPVQSSNIVSDITLFQRCT